MRVSPLDIRKQEFTKAFRGYEIEEVNAFLQMIAREFEEARDDHRRLEDQLRGLEEKIRHYERVEEALQEALQTARDSTRKAVQNAEERARLIVRDAESRASEITRDAQASLETMRAETGRLANRQHEIVARLRAFLTAETEMLNRFERNELDGSAASQTPHSSSQAGGVQHTAIRSAAVASAPRERLPHNPSPASTPTVVDDDDDVEDVFNPAAQDADDDVQPLRGGAFNVRSLIASARAAAEDHADDEAMEDPDVVEAYLEADDSDSGEDEANVSRGKQATEEIEKIRRILNDLD